MKLTIIGGGGFRVPQIYEALASDGDHVRVARTWTKWAYEVQRVEDIPTAVRRALQIARTLKVAEFSEPRLPACEAELRKLAAYSQETKKAPRVCDFPSTVMPSM